VAAGNRRQTENERVTGARSVAIVRQPDAPLTGAVPVAWAVEEFRAALVARGIGARVVDTVSLADPDALVILIADANLPDAAAMLARAGVTVPRVPEA
jgi:hypothetical protein